MVMISKNLSNRHRDESIFHNEKYGNNSKKYPRHYTVNPTYPIYQRMLSMAIKNQNISNRAVLEYGCGEGWITRDLVLAGADVTSFDISVEAIRKTRMALAEDGLISRCKVAQMGAEKLEYNDESFDTAIGFAILHHLDLELAISELHRVLRPGGVAYFAEPLGGNPLINLYRLLTPQYRTVDEMPLNLQLLSPMLSRFRSFDHTEHYFIALVGLALAYLPFGNKLYPKVNRFLNKVDEVIIKSFPGIGHLAWYTIISIRK